jgi:hypothetical protein
MPVSKAAIKDQMQHLEYFHSFFNRSELRHLPKVIREGETLRAIARGKFEGAHWLVVATDQRLLLIDKGVLFGEKLLEFPLTEIQTIQQTTGFFKGELIIETANGTRRVENLKKKGAMKIADIVSRLIYSARSPHSSSMPPSVSCDAVSQLERLAKLRESGALTEEEFQNQKKKLL